VDPCLGPKTEFRNTSCNKSLDDMSRLKDQVTLDLSVSSEDSRVYRAEERSEGKIQCADLSLTL